MNKASIEVPMEYLKRHEAAKYLRVSLRTFDALSAKSLFPKFRVSGNRIVFRKKDLDNYILKNEVEPEDTESVAAASNRILRE